jgi:hypothetical protein
MPPNPSLGKKHSYTQPPPSAIKGLGEQTTAITPEPATRGAPVVPLSGQSRSDTPAPWTHLKRAVRSPQTEANLTPTGGLPEATHATPGMSGITRGSGAEVPTPGPEAKRGRIRKPRSTCRTRASPFHVKYPLPPPCLREKNTVKVINEKGASTDSPGFTMATGINPTTNLLHSGRLFLGLSSLLTDSTTSRSLLKRLEHTVSTRVACLTILPLQIPVEDFDAFADVPLLLDSMFDGPPEKQLTATVSWLTNRAGVTPTKGSHTSEYAFLVLTREDIESLSGTEGHHFSCVADEVLKSAVGYYLNPSPSGHPPEIRAAFPPASTGSELPGALSK